MTIGNLRKRNKIIKQEPIEILGIMFHHNEHESNTQNWNKTIEIIKKNLNKWKGRKMTILGRVTTLNSFAISQLLYLNRIYAITNNNLKRLEKLLNNYIFDTRPQNYANANMIRSIKEGGFGLPDIEKKCEAQQLQWMIYYLGSETEANWKIIFQENNRNLIKLQENLSHPDRKRQISKLTNKELQTFRIIEKIKSENIEKNWREISYRDIYITLKKKKEKKFKIEEILKHTNWEEIWGRWEKRNIHNKYKIMEHEIISDKYNTIKYYNKSKNCPGCDYALVQSRDHSFMNCIGAKELQEYIKRTHQIEMRSDKLFMGRANDIEYHIVLGYIATIRKMTKLYIGKWGRASQAMKIEYLEKTLAKIRR